MNNPTNRTRIWIVVVMLAIVAGFASVRLGWLHQSQTASIVLLTLAVFALVGVLVGIRTGIRSSRKDRS